MRLPRVPLFSRVNPQLCFYKKLKKKEKCIFFTETCLLGHHNHQTLSWLICSQGKPWTKQRIKSVQCLSVLHLMKYCLYLKQNYNYMVCYNISGFIFFFLQQSTSPQKQTVKNRSKSTDEVQQAKKVIKSSRTSQTLSECALSLSWYPTSDLNL